MDSRGQVWLSAAAGALAGAAVGYLFLTPAGRRLREELGPELTQLMRELQRLQDLADSPRRRGA